MTLFYLVSCPDPDIRYASWKLFSRTLCIFLAVLISKTTTKVASDLVLRVSADDSLTQALSAVGEPQVEVDNKAILLSFVCWLLFWLFFILYLLHYKGTHMSAWSKLGGHVVAFAGLDAFTALESGHEPFDVLRATALNHCGYVVAVGIVMWVSMELAGGCRKFLVDVEAREEWLDECREAEDEGAALVIGLLWSQTIRHAISGEHPPLHGGKPHSKSNSEVFSLLLIVLALAGIVVKLETLLKTVLADLEEAGKTERRKRRMARCIRVVVDTVSMTMAWCLLYWGEWVIYNWTDDRGVGHGDKMTALLVVAAVLSALCFAGIFVIVFAARSSAFTAHHVGLHALGTALGLVVGCAWEDVFIEAVGGVRQLHFLQLDKSYSTLLVISMLCVVTLPAWMLYIEPRSHLVQDLPHDSNNPLANDSLTQREGS